MCHLTQKERLRQKEANMAATSETQEVWRRERKKWSERGGVCFDLWPWCQAVPLCHTRWTFHCLTRAFWTEEYSSSLRYLEISRAESESLANWQIALYVILTITNMYFDFKDFIWNNYTSVIHLAVHRFLYCTFKKYFDFILKCLASFSDTIFFHKLNDRMYEYISVWNLVYLPAILQYTYYKLYTRSWNDMTFKRSGWKKGRKWRKYLCIMIAFHLYSTQWKQYNHSSPLKGFLTHFVQLSRTVHRLTPLFPQSDACNKHNNFMKSYSNAN